MKILFTGLGGLTGSHLSTLLLKSTIKDQNTYFSILRSNSSSYLSLPSRVLCEKNIFYGDIENEQFCFHVINSIKPDLIVHLAQIKLVPMLINAAINTNIKPRILCLGTTAIYSSISSCSSPYLNAEKYLRDKWSDFLVIRSSMIYGSSMDKNIHKLFQAIFKNQPIPIPGGGKTLYQPIFFKDVATIIYSLLLNRELVGFYNCPGPDKLSLLELVEIISDLLNRKAITIPLPIMPSYYSLRLLEVITSRLSFKLPVNSEQILRLSEDKISSSNTMSLLPEFKYTSILEGLKEQMLEMKLRDL